MDHEDKDCESGGIGKSYETYKINFGSDITKIAFFFSIQDT